MLKSTKGEPSLHSIAGFSLVEVTLAIGIAAFCFIAVIGIVPVGVQTNRNATSQTVATNIMAAAVTDLRATQKTKTASPQLAIPVPSDHRLGAAPDCQRCASCWNTQTTTKYFDASGKSVVSTSAAALYRVTVTQVQNPAATVSTGALFYDARATWPAQADPCATTPSGSVEMFVALDRN